MHVTNPNETFEILQEIRKKPTRADLIQQKFKHFESQIIDYATDQLLRLDLIMRTYEKVGKVDYIVWNVTERGKQVVDSNIPLRSLS